MIVCGGITWRKACGRGHSPIEVREKIIHCVAIDLWERSYQSLECLQLLVQLGEHCANEKERECE